METFANTCINMSMNMPTCMIVFMKIFQIMSMNASTLTIIFISAIFVNGHLANTFTCTTMKRNTITASTWT